MTASPNERHRAGLEARMPMVCGLRHLGGCAGRPQADHVIEKQALKRERRDAAERARTPNRAPEPRDEALLAVSEDDLVADARNGWWLCELHHSRKWTTRIDPDWLPLEVDAFADEYGLRHELDRLKEIPHA